MLAFSARQKSTTWPPSEVSGQVWRHIAAYPVTTEGGFSHGEPTTLFRNLSSLAAYTVATPENSRLLIRVSPDAAQDKGEIRLLFGWQNDLRQRNP